MQRRRFLAHAAALAACPLCAAAAGAARAAEGAGPAWAYEGARGPAAWGGLAPSYAACGSGERQSPVDLGNATPAMLATPDVDWPAMPLVMANTGHTIVVEATAYATMGLGVDGQDWRLKSFHFHHPSEHTVEGRAFPLEIHFVHEDAQGGRGLAVAGIFVRSGAFNPTLETIFSAMPREPGLRITLDTLVTPALLLPEERETWRYHGSLTTPPCTEVVRWVVYTQPIEAAAEQIQAFAGLFPMNARPVQPLGRRHLLLDFF